MLLEGAIKSQAATAASYTKGCQYYRDKHVQNLYFADNNIVMAKVQGRELYNVHVRFGKRQGIDHYGCDCPAFYRPNGACKHIIAVLKTVQQEWGRFAGAGFPGAKQLLPFSPATQDMLSFFQHNAAGLTKDAEHIQVKLIPTFAFSASRTGTVTGWLEFLIGTERMYVVKNIPQLLDAIEDSQELSYGKSFILRPREMVFDASSAALLAMLRHTYREEKQRMVWGYNSSYGSLFSDARRFRLTDTNLLRFFDAMGDQPFAALINQQAISGISIQNRRPPLRLAVKAVEGGLQLTMDLGAGGFYGLDADLHYIYYNKLIYKVDDHFARYLKPLLKCFSESSKPEVHIPSSAVSDFVAAALPALETIAAVQVDDAVYDRFHKEPLEKRVYLDKYGSGMSARVEFVYGGISINPSDHWIMEEGILAGKWLLRATTEENQVLSLFLRRGFSWAEGKLVQEDEEATYDFLRNDLPDLRDIAEVFYTDDIKRIGIKHTGKIAGGVRLNTDTNMLEFSLTYEDMSPQELWELLAAYKLKKQYHRLQDGTFIALDSPEFQAAAGLIDELGLRAADIDKQVIQLPKYRALYLDSLTREVEDFKIERSGAFKKMVQDIREPQDVEYTLPAGIQGQLRDYQKTGYKWLKSLASYGFGGILADDMGLGKTLQVITFILSEKNEEPMPSLVIAPTSLVYNWREEVMKFAPGLKVTVVSGLQPGRQEQLQDIEQADLVVTSYGLVKRDIELYQNKVFKYCFLDEAQHVKNPNTLNAKAVKKIKAKSYFALTGTPIENTLTELWSIFDFIMPGYLRTHRSFTSRFEIPIVKNSDQKALRELGRHTKPFILRRMKKAVLKELPEKIESKMTAEMTTEQIKIYNAWLLKARAEFDQEIAASGFQNSQIKILSLLTRLRQICCHPSLFLENYHGGSGKLEMLQEILEDAVGSGHRILLFSQFTGMLDLIKQELDARQMSYHYLDGATKAEERIKRVHAFNAGDKDVFLISLKAGGTGLNLTGADMVIHYDPWWNPAVEEQATDRAYRIGQKNSVQVYKLITQNTIEEKIYHLQQKKRQLIDTLIEPGENFLAKMSEAEIRALFDNY